jgi:hypothetical protein
MPFGLGLHILLALVCAVHVVRSGQQLYWLFILFAFPLLGSLVYVFAVYLPNSRIERRAVRVVGTAARALDPHRAVREARAALDETPSAQNQLHLAAALLDVGSASEAVEWYERCLTGPFASDLEIRLGTARALIECGRYADALEHLMFIRRTRADFRPETIAILIARCLGATGRADEARAEFHAAVERFGTFEARVEYAIWARSVGDGATADRLNVEIDRIVGRWNPHTRELNAVALRRLKAANAGAPDVRP